MAPKKDEPVEETEEATGAPLATTKTPVDQRLQCRKCRRYFDKGVPTEPNDGLYVCDSCGATEGHA